MLLTIYLIVLGLSAAVVVLADYWLSHLPERTVRREERWVGRDVLPDLPPGETRPPSGEDDR